ncbi:MAG: deoxyribonuclease IV [Acidobacteriia bacterium]|nr:deoxyribonuclease IV [Terriglobia bacterium]
MTYEPLVGAHMSIAGGIHLAFERGLRAGCRTLQIFLKNSNQWKAKRLTDEDRRLYAEAQEKSGIAPVLAHSSYLINLATPDRALYRKSQAAFVEELKRANFLGVSAVILHPGAHRSSGEVAGIAAIAAALNHALDQVPPPVSILLENTAGQGSSIGHSFEQLAAILEGVRDADRIGFCLDTCHLFAAGYDISIEAGYRRTLRLFDRLIGCRKIRAFHMNDCRKPLGCRVDRHTHIGQGCIGLEAFRCLVNDRRFAAVPKILETPKGDDLKLDLMNLRTLRGLVA